MKEEIRKELGKYFLDISKLVFGGSVLASIIKMEEISRSWILIVGLAVTLVFASFGFIILKRK